MSLTAQTIRPLLAALAVCLAAVVSANKAAAQATVQAESKQGSDIRGVVTYADTGRPLRHARVALFNLGNGGQSDTVTDLRGRFVFSGLPRW